MAAGTHENEDGPAGPVDLRRSPHAKLRPLGLHDAAITGGFLADRQRLNRERLIPEGHERLEDAGNFHDLRVAAGREEGEFRGLVFMDSDVHKWLEAVGWELAREPSDTLAALADDVIGLLEAAQEDDGYLNSYYQVVAPRPRFTNLSWDHELYCAGHLIQAAVAHARGPRGRAAARRRPAPRRPHRRALRRRRRPRRAARAPRDRDRARRARAG